MTLQEILAACDRMKPNACPEQEKRRWLSELDGRIYRELLACHEGAPETFSGYDMQTAGGTELLVPEPVRGAVSLLSFGTDRFCQCGVCPL